MRKIIQKWLKLLEYILFIVLSLMIKYSEILQQIWHNSFIILGVVEVIYIIFFLIF